MNNVTSKWLEDTNEDFRKRGITDNEDKFRLAAQKWINDENLRELLTDDKIDPEILRRHTDKQIEKIEAYFLTQTVKDRGYVYPPFVGIFYYLGGFWQVIIPLVFGRAGIKIFEQLDTPREVNQRLYSDKESMNEYISVWEDSQDYAYGIREVESKCPSDFSKQLFRSADKDLRSTISLLSQEKVSPKSIEDSALAVEIFLKAFFGSKRKFD